MDRILKFIWVIVALLVGLSSITLVYLASVVLWQSARFPFSSIDTVSSLTDFVAVSTIFLFLISPSSSAYPQSLYMVHSGVLLVSNLALLLVWVLFFYLAAKS